MEKQDLGKSSTGLQPNAAALFSYLLGIISGIVFLVIEKDNKFVRFHALQSIITFGGILVLRILCGIIVFLIPLIPFLQIITLVLWVMGQLSALSTVE